MANIIRGMQKTKLNCTIPKSIVSLRGIMTSGQMKGYGSTEVVEINKETPLLHDPFQGKLLIRVKAVGINPMDWKIHEGYYVYDPSRDRIFLTIRGDYHR